MILYSPDEVCDRIDEAVDTLSGLPLRRRLAEILGADDRGYPTCSVLMATAPANQEIAAIVGNASKHGDWCRKVTDPYNPDAMYLYTRGEDRALISEMIEEDAANQVPMEMAKSA